MDIGNAEFNAGELVRKNLTINVNVSGLRALRIRLWVGGLSMRFGAWIMDVPIMIQTKEE